MCFIFHKWGKWITKMNVTTDHGQHTVQDKICERCGILKWRYV